MLFISTFYCSVFSNVSVFRPIIFFHQCKHNLVRKRSIDMEQLVGHAMTRGAWNLGDWGHHVMCTGNAHMHAARSQGNKLRSVGRSRSRCEGQRRYWSQAPISIRRAHVLCSVVCTHTLGVSFAANNNNWPLVSLSAEKLLNC